MRILTRKITRKQPFRVEKLPWIARVYRFPLDHWSSPYRQFTFGLPWKLLFFLRARLWPFPCRGRFSVDTPDGRKSVAFDARNSQFSALYSKRFASGYEPDITALLDAIVGPRAVFYDIGSNWGWFAVFVACRPGFEGRVHAFEPFPPTFRDLDQVVRQAGLEGRITCHPVALSDRAGTVEMKLPDHFSSGLAHAEQTTAPAATGSAGIASATLDGLDLPPPDVMKIDVEGFETRVLRGGANLLRNKKPMLVIESGCSTEQPEQTLAPLLILEKAGYQLFHAGWLREHEERPYLISDDLYLPAQAGETLVLQAFAAAERFFRPSGMNIFACHNDRLAELESLFQPREI